MDKSSFYHLQVNRRQHRSYIISLFLTISVSQYCKLLERFPAEQLFAQTCLCYNSSGMFCLHMQLPFPAREKPRARPWLQQLMQEGDEGGGRASSGMCINRSLGNANARRSSSPPHQHLAAKLVTFSKVLPREQRESSPITQ